MFDSYRPELHYMRGPGPKCREKAERLTAPPQPVIPYARGVVVHRQLRQRFVREWLPSGVATFAIGAVLQYALSSLVAFPVSHAPASGPQKAEFVAAEPVATPSESAPALVPVAEAGQGAATVQPPAEPTETAQSPAPQQAQQPPVQSSPRTARKRSHEQTAQRESRTATRSTGRVTATVPLPPTRALAPTRPALSIDETFYSFAPVSPQPFSIAELDNRLQSGQAAQQTPCPADGSGWHPLQRCSAKGADR